mgnify:CR=1 FL=1
MINNIIDTIIMRNPIRYVKSLKIKVVHSSPDIFVLEHN